MLLIKSDSPEGSELNKVMTVNVTSRRVIPEEARKKSCCNNVRVDGEKVNICRCHSLRLKSF